MRTLIITSLLLFIAITAVYGQSCTPLKPSESTSSLFSDLLGDEGEAITDVCEMAAGDDSYSIRVTHQGFTDKEYQISAQALGADRRKIMGCEPVSQPLDAGSSTTDLTLRFDAGNTAYTDPYVKVRYLKISIAEADDLLAGLNIEGLNLSGTSAEYRIDHSFRVGANSNGSSNVTVSVSFTPVGKAGSIKQ